MRLEILHNIVVLYIWGVWRIYEVKFKDIRFDVVGSRVCVCVCVCVFCCRNLLNIVIFFLNVMAF